MRSSQTILALTAAVAWLMINGAIQPDALGQVVIGSGLVLIVMLGVFLVSNVNGDLARRLKDTENELRASSQRISQLEHLVENIRTQDEASGCFNQRHFKDLLKHHRGMAERGRYTFTICLLEILGFDEFRGRVGESRAEGLLRQAGAAMIGALREIDAVARIEGGRFGVILAGANARDSAKVVSRLEGLIQRQCAKGEAMGDLVAVCGLAEFAADLAGADLLDRAQAALREVIDQRGRRVAAE